MRNKILPKSTGEDVFPPAQLSEKQNWLCKRLDDFHVRYKLRAKPSDMLRGAVFVSQQKIRSNPDWIAQAANSLREILYPFYGRKVENVPKNKEKILKQYGSVKFNKELIGKMGRIWGILNGLTHHGNVDKNNVDFSKFTSTDFEKLFRNFENIMLDVLARQIDIHKEIDNILAQSPILLKSEVENIKDLINLNPDSRQYFYAKADENWLDWLWENGFLDEIKKKAEDSTKYSYRLPELGYLTRMAEKEPAKVAKIIDSVKISEANFNPEVIDRFLWIISILPPEQIKILTAKIRNEKWIYLMRKFRKTGYEFEKIIKKLIERKENDAIIELAQSILSVKSKVEISEEGSSFSADDPFYVSDLDASGVFEALTDIEDLYTEKALQITTGIMAEIVKLAEPDDKEIFDYKDLFLFYNVDFFTLEIKNKRSDSYREDIKNLAATIKRLVERTIGKKCGNVQEAKELFNSIDKKLFYISDARPSCQSMWRLRLFVLAQCPYVFKKELKDAFFKVFEVGERYFEIEGGAEYYQALIRGFGAFDSKTEQREYIKKIFEYFGANLEDKEKEKWRRRDGLQILSCIKDYLTPEEKEKAKEELGNFPDEISFAPKPDFEGIRSGYVSHRSPVNLDDFKIDQIIVNLKNEWTLAKFEERFKDDDFLNPRGVEGLGDDLKENIQKRTSEYLEKISEFFDRDLIHPHYLYSLLWGIEEMIRSKQSLSLYQIGQLFGLFEIIQNSGEKTPFTRENNKSWLVGWIGVHKVITDILLYVLEDADKEKRAEIHKIHREKIKNLISYLFTIKDSPSKDDEKPEYGEPYHIAINSVRGRAYEVFVVFSGDDGEILANDIQELYKKSLSDDSLAVRFVIGRYLASFYFRDKEFIIDLLPEIFPKDNPDKKDMYLATWEGYLSNTLYDKLFIALKDYYSHAIALDSKDYTQRKYWKGLDESLAIHLALAFAHLGLAIEDDLFVQFWNKPNIKRHQEFISFIGRSCLTRDQAGDEWLKENKVSEDKLIDFWNWALKNVSEPEVLSGFGFWINPNKEVLDDKIVVEKMAQTFKKSDGDIDWDYGLLRRLPIFAEKNREKTFEIIWHFLLDSKNNLNQNRRAPLMYETEIKNALKIIYKNGDVALKQKITDLINTLIEKGSSMFWNLKEVIN